MTIPNFKKCEYFVAEAGGICRRAQYLEELAPFNARGEQIQCCFLQPVPIFSCPNPKINSGSNSEPSKLVDSAMEKLDDLDDKIHSLTSIDSTYVLDVITEILDEFRKEIQSLRENIRQETKNTLETLESRVSKVEKSMYAERRPEILFPNAEQDRPPPIQNKSAKAKQTKDYTDPTTAEKEFHDKIKSLPINEDILNDDFFKDLNLDEPF